MVLANDAGGRPLVYKYKENSFEIGGKLVSLGDVIALDEAGQLHWRDESYRVQTLEQHSTNAPRPAFAQPEERDRPNPKWGQLLIALLVLIVLGSCCKTCGGGDDREKSGSTRTQSSVSQAAVLEYLQAHFPGDVVAVELEQEAGPKLTVNVYTTYYPDPDIRDAAGGIARVAAQAQPILDEYSSVEVVALVWPEDKSFYITRASASYTNGKLDAPMDFFENDVLK